MRCFASPGPLQAGSVDRGRSGQITGPIPAQFIQQVGRTAVADTISLMIQLPKDVSDWLTGVFLTCNHEASSKLTLVPNGHEPWLDFAIIETFNGFPFRFASSPIGSSTSTRTHWLGNAPLWPEFDRRWEIADIGFLVMFRTRNEADAVKGGTSPVQAALCR